MTDFANYPNSGGGSPGGSLGGYDRGSRGNRGGANRGQRGDWGNFGDDGFRPNRNQGGGLPSSELRQPPNNQEAELALLGAMLFSTQAIADALEAGIKDWHFYSPAHAAIYLAITELDMAGQPGGYRHGVEQAALFGRLQVGRR